MAFSFPSSIALVISLKSLETSDKPAIPDFLLSMFVISEMSFPSFFAITSIMPGSMSPERVPIITPARGVSPILVSTDLPFSTAQMLAPFPRWQTIVFNLSYGLSIISATRFDTKLCDVPWKPYLLILFSS